MMLKIYQEPKAQKKNKLDEILRKLMQLSKQPGSTWVCPSLY